MQHPSPGLGSNGTGLPLMAKEVVVATLLIANAHAAVVRVSFVVVYSLPTANCRVRQPYTV